MAGRLGHNLSGLAAGMFAAGAVFQSGFVAIPGTPGAGLTILIVGLIFFTITYTKLRYRRRLRTVIASVVGFVATAVAFTLTQNLPILAALAAFFGSTAPDWLEITWVNPGRGSKGTSRGSLIPHRTITHWLAGWVILLGLSYSYLNQSILATTSFGFAIGGIMHLLMDFPNPMGIRVLNPFVQTKVKARWVRRNSHQKFGWWVSGQHDGLLGLIWCVLGLGYLIYVGGADDISLTTETLLGLLSPLQLSPAIRSF